MTCVSVIPKDEANVFLGVCLLMLNAARVAAFIDGW
jgi:hypothetical protein